MDANGNRIKQARQIRGMSFEGLAAKIDCETHQLVRYEANLDPTPKDKLERIAIATTFPLAFFFQSNGPEFPLGSMLFHERTAPPCDFCAQGSGNFQCDFPLKEECKECHGRTERKGFHVCRRCMGSGIEPCSANICASCTKSKGEGVNRVDYCPMHQRTKGIRA